MGDPVTTRKGLLITGGPGTERTKLAQKIMDFVGFDTARVIHAHGLTSRFIFAHEPNIIIVEGCEQRDVHALKSIIVSDQVQCEKKGHDMKMIPSPRVIATSLYNIDLTDDRRFIHISLGGELPCPTR